MIGREVFQSFLFIFGGCYLSNLIIPQFNEQLPCFLGPVFMGLVINEAEILTLNESYVINKKISTFYRCAFNTRSGFQNMD